MESTPLTAETGRTLRSPRARVRRILLIALAMLAPILVAVLLTALRGQNLFRSVPTWSDEQWWYVQYAAIRRFGRPLGYFGYAGTHARVGTFGPWGMYPALLIGYAARLFGWGLHSFVYYNAALLALGMLVFILLTEPSDRGILRLAAANATAYIAVCYLSICMNECVRFAMALVLAGIVYRVAVVPEVSRVRQILRWTLVPLLLLYATAFYTILGAFIPVYLILMLRRWKPGWRVAAALPVTYAAIQLMRRLNNSTACPYITGDGISFTPPTLKLKLMTFFYSVLGNAEQIDPYRLLTRAEESSADPMLLWFCVLLYVLMGVLIWRLIVSWKAPEKRLSCTIEAASLFLLLCFWGGHIVLYNTTDWTFMRGCFPAVYCTAMLCALLPREERHVWRADIIVSLTGLIVFVSVFSNTFTPGSHFSTAAQDAQYRAKKDTLGEIITLAPDAADPWANTLVLIGVEPEIYFSLPDGVGLNGQVDDVINADARYVLVGYNYGDPENRAANLDTLQEHGHVIVYEDETCTVLENTAKTFG